MVVVETIHTGILYILIVPQDLVVDEHGLQPLAARSSARKAPLYGKVSLLLEEGW